MIDGSDLAWRDRHKAWLDFVSGFTRALAIGSEIQTGPSKPHLKEPSAQSVASRGTRVLICSPHPDDEALIGGLALRLRLESGAEIVNCAITLGTNKKRRAQRREEVEASCSVLGFKLIVPS